MLQQFTALESQSPVASIIISIALMLICGFGMTRLTKLLKLPDVTAYIIAGIVMGPYCLHLVPTDLIEGMDFLSDIALAFIAFSTGEFFKFSELKKNGIKVTVITVFEACITSVFIFVAIYYILHLDLAFSIVLAALAAATAPASTVMTIRQTGAKGDFVNTLLQVVALDDAVGLIEYSIAISIAVASISEKANAFSIENMAKPIGINILVFLAGCLFGLFMKLLLTAKRTTDNRLIVSIALLFTFCGICAMLDVSPLLGCMAMGTVYMNLTNDDKLFKQLNYFSPPILLLFFVRSGLSFNLDALFGSSVAIGTTSLLVVGIIYFFVRIVGKYVGSYLGCLVVHKSWKVRNYLGLALIPQAGVAIGLAALGARTLGGETGIALQTIILASSVLYELIGPGCAKLALYLSGSYNSRLEEIVSESELTDTGQKKTEVDMLIERLQKIQGDMSDEGRPASEEEAAFLEAAEDQLAAMAYGGYLRHPHIRRYGNG